MDEDVVVIDSETKKESGPLNVAVFREKIAREGIIVKDIGVRRVDTGVTVILSNDWMVMGFQKRGEKWRVSSAFLQADL